MKKLNNFLTSVDDSSASEMIRSWSECLPGELSDLFYQAQKPGPVERYKSYFSLGRDGIDQLLALEGKGKSIRLCMGCRKVIDPNSETAVNTFVPLLEIPSAGIGPASFFEMKYNFPEPAGEAAYDIALDDDSGTTIITPDVAKLFREKWNELTDMEVGNAFSGATYKNYVKIEFPIKVGNNNIVDITEKIYTGNLEARRVLSYVVVKEDVELIIQCLKSLKINSDTLILNMYMGAGLTVQVKHPFNFRPIFEVPSRIKLGYPSIEVEEEEDPVKVYFDRSRPCPPFCDPGE